ncbi:MAG TPA: gas vesicle protein GvpO [Acidimicrobiales bacterium]|nr:gas vesicle protein GvpO [Acidimicrobiales bacterium]
MHDELEAREGLDAMTKAELKGEARARGLQVSGTREQLLRRLREHDDVVGDDGGGGRDAPATGDGGPPQAGGENTPSEEGDAVRESGDRAGGTDGEPAEVASHDGDGDEVGGHSHDGDRHRPQAAGRLGELLGTATASVEQLVGQPVDSVSGVTATDDGFRVDVQVVEVSRIPPTTDVLATYEVDLDAEGEVTGFARTDRYYRNQTRDT